MKVLGLIPSRMGSTRLPAKALLPISGIPLVIHTYKRASLSKLINKIIICTDSKKIEIVAKKFKAKSILTSQHHKNGTERITEAYIKEGKQYDLVLYELHKASYKDMTPVMNKSSEIILKWASEGNKSWIPWRSDPAKIHKAAALNALIYASKTNPTVGLNKNPSREAWLLIEENFLEFLRIKAKT